MTVFETMLDYGFRSRFIEKKKRSFSTRAEDLEKLSSYILSEECTAHIRQLAQGDYFFSVPQLIKLRKINSNKRRIVYRFTDKEICLMKLMSYALHKYDYLYSDSLYSFRLQKRNADLFQKISRIPDRKQLYVLKTDISNYGGNVDHEILIRDLKATLKPEDGDLCAFLEWLLSRNEYRQGTEVIRGSMGALSGTPLAAFLENVYLLCADSEMISRSVMYCRYCDDVAVFVRTRAEAEECREILKRMLGERGLSFNSEKTVIYEPGEDVEILGIRISGDHFDISEHSLGKIKWKMTHRRNKLLKRIQTKRLTKEQALDQMIGYVNAYFYGVKRADCELNWVAWSFPILTREKSLKEIDAHVQDCIRVVGSGKKTDAKYRITYKTMVEHGYRNLVHAYYHGYEVMEDPYEATAHNTESSGGESGGGAGDDSGIQ